MLRATKSFKNAFEWCVRKGLLPPKRMCRCGYEMFVRRCTRFLADECCFKCPSQSCKRKISLRTGSLFEASKLTLMEVMRIVFYYFVRGFNAAQASTDLNELYPCGYAGVCKAYKKVRKQIHLHTQNEYSKYKLGSSGRPVEVDESVFTHVRFGSSEKKVWVLGLFERETKEARLFVIDDREAETLTPIVQEHVQEGNPRVSEPFSKAQS